VLGLVGLVLELGLVFRLELGTMSGATIVLRVTQKTRTMLTTCTLASHTVVGEFSVRCWPTPHAGLSGNSAGGQCMHC